MISRHRPFLAYWDWQRDARCRGMDVSVFFSPTGERGSERLAREAGAREICARCPVRDICARIALDAREEYGFWGGLSERERERERMRRRRARPPRAA
ncbi:WhiB family transcriptional regulator [Streptomyces sp. NPDC048277]|uniref:WhiB family transcriptional regulator n=1 Tax=Streptomyces sp. NPDC048277 TaxID=3155027 RepID=UPI0033E6A2C8